MSTNLDGAVAACGGGGSDLEYLNTFLTPQFLSTDIPATLSRGFINDGSITCCAQFSNFEDGNPFSFKKPRYSTYHVLVTRYVSQQRRELLLRQQAQHGDVERHGGPDFTKSLLLEQLRGKG